MRTVAIAVWILLTPMMLFSIEVQTSDVEELTAIIDELSRLNEEQARELRGLKNELDALQTITNGQAFYLHAQRESFDAWAREQARILQATRDQRDAAIRAGERSKRMQIVVGILGVVGGAALTFGITQIAN